MYTDAFLRLIQPTDVDFVYETQLPVHEAASRGDWYVATPIAAGLSARPLQVRRAHYVMKHYVPASSGFAGIVTREPKPARNLDLAPAFTALDRLRNLRPNWNGYGADAPNHTAMHWARMILENLRDTDLTPSRVVASAEGGVGISFTGKGRIGALEALNSGTILAVLSDRTSDPQVWAVVGVSELKEALSHIADYLA